MDVHLEVPSVPFRELSDMAPGTGSGEMRQQVEAAREIQGACFHGFRIKTNGKMAPQQIRKFCRLDSDAETLLKTAMEEMGLSARAHDKILRVSRTIADLDRSDNISALHLSEAINYRTLDRNYWA